MILLRTLCCRIATKSERVLVAITTRDREAFGAVEEATKPCALSGARSQEATALRGGLVETVAFLLTSTFVRVISVFIVISTEKVHLG